MYAYRQENVKIKEYCSKVYYPFYFDESKHKLLIEECKASKKWTNLSEVEIAKRKNELLPDVIDYLFSDCEGNNSNTVCIFKVKSDDELKNNSIDEYDMLFNLKNLKLIDGNQKTNFSVKDVELFLFSDGIGILTFVVDLGDNTSKITSPGRILDFNKTFKLDNNTKDNIVLRKLDGSEMNTNLKKIIEKIISEPISGLITSFYERGIIHLRYVKFESYQTSDEFKCSTFGFMYYLMNMFNKSDIIEVPDDLSQSQVYMPQGNIAHFFTLKGGGIFVYENGEEFINDNRFKENVMCNYSIGLILALHQRIAMLKISKGLTNVFLNDENNITKKNKIMLNQTEEILEKFRGFTAKSWFREFSNIEGRNNYFKTWQKCFDLECLFQDMRNEIQDINEYLRFLDFKKAEKSRDNQNNIMVAITLIFIPLNLFVGFMGMNIKAFNIENMSFKTTVIYFSGIIIVSWFIVLMVYGVKKIKNFICKN